MRADYHIEVGHKLPMIPREPDAERLRALTDACVALVNGELADAQLMPGLSRCDSITIDPHKALFLPYVEGSVLVRDGELLRRAHRIDAGYLRDLDTGEEEVNFNDLSPELTRPFRGLAVWLRTHADRMQDALSAIEAEAAGIQSDFRLRALRAGGCHGQAKLARADVPRASLRLAHATRMKASLVCRFRSGCATSAMRRSPAPASYAPPGA